MFSYTRLNEILHFFIEHPDHISPKELCKKYNISERTLRNDIHQINDELYTFDSKINMTRGTGYSLQSSPENIKLIKSMIDQSDSNLYSSENRINHIILKMLYSDDYLSQDDMADEVFVSTNTIVNYLKTIRIILSDFELKLKTKSNIGYKIIGSELNKRKCILSLVNSTYQSYEYTFSKEQKELLNEQLLDEIQKIVENFNQKNNLHFSDYNLKNLILHIALSINRSSMLYGIETDNLPENHEIQEFLNPLIKEIESLFLIRLTQNEKKYIYSHYVSNTNEIFDLENNNDYIISLVNKLLEEINRSYHYDLRSDFILKNDLAHHLKAILNARYYHLNKKNPLLNTIKSKYILSYEITETAIKQVLENESFELSDDEIGYISLHIGAAIERYYETRSNQSKRALILYHCGYATGSFIASKLTKYFRNSLEICGIYPANEYDQIDKNKIDFIISTKPIDINSKKIIHMELPLTLKDISKIGKMIANDNEHPIDRIRFLFDDDLFIKQNCKSKEDIIHLLCDQLNEKGYVSKQFETSVIERENKISTLMDGVIALPHPLQICSDISKVCIGILDKPISWNNKSDKAQIIFLLALADDSKENIGELYDTFVYMMNNPSLQKQIIDSNSLEEFIEVLKNSIPYDYY